MLFQFKKWIKVEAFLQILQLKKYTIFWQQNFTLKVPLQCLVKKFKSDKLQQQAKKSNTLRTLSE